MTVTNLRHCPCRGIITYFQSQEGSITLYLHDQNPTDEWNVATCHILRRNSKLDAYRAKSWSQKSGPSHTPAVSSVFVHARCHLKPL